VYHLFGEAIHVISCDGKEAFRVLMSLQLLALQKRAAAKSASLQDPALPLLA
jgi:hypothetical protein